MNVSGILSGTAALDKYGYLNGSAGLDKSNENPFLELLVAQLKNQDPMEPLQNGDFIQQVSSFASLQETQLLNAKISDLISLQEIVAGQNAFSQSASLVGKHVQYLDPDTGETLSGHVESVHLNEGGLLVRINGTDVPMSSITGILAEDAPPATTDDDGDSDEIEQEESGESGL